MSKKNEKTENVVEPKKISRIVSAVRVLVNLDKPISRDEILRKADKLYVENGGKSNLRESLYGYRVASEVLTELGYIAKKTENVVITPVKKAE